MIRKINLKDLISVFVFIKECNDCYFDFYVTVMKERKFLKGNWELISKILKHQEVYAVEDKGEIKGILIIYRTKNFRPYLKILAKDSKTEWDLLRFFSWHYFGEIYAKLKLTNPLVRTLQKQNRITKRLTFGFISKGFRGKEILLYRPKQLKKEIIIGE